jgi:hypothetical protein
LSGLAADVPWANAFRQAAPSLSIAHLIFSSIQVVQYFTFVAPLPALSFDLATKTERRSWCKETVWQIYSIFRHDPFMPGFNLALFVLSVLACARTLNRTTSQLAVVRVLDSAGIGFGKSNIFYPLILADYMRTKV